MHQGTDRPARHVRQAVVVAVVRPLGADAAKSLVRTFTGMEQRANDALRRKERARWATETRA